MPAANRPSAGAGEIDAAVYGAAYLSLAAALVHLWSVPLQSVLWWGYGLLFAAIGLAQGTYAVALLRRPTQGLFLVGIWPGLALFSLYVVWYTHGIPFGPHTGMPMDPDATHVAGALAQLGTTIALTTLLRGTPRRATINALFFVGAAAWVAMLFDLF